jgi:hypothetical protein
MQRGMVGNFNGFNRFGIEGGVERTGRGTVLRRGGQATWSSRLPWAWRSRPESCAVRRRATVSAP